MPNNIMEGATCARHTSHTIDTGDTRQASIRVPFPTRPLQIPFPHNAHPTTTFHLYRATNSARLLRPASHTIIPPRNL